MFLTFNNCASSNVNLVPACFSNAKCSLFCISFSFLSASSNIACFLGIGPVEMADLINFMSEKFKVTFHRSDIQNLRTVNDLVVAIEDLSLE
jgi:hypothetical protein